MTVARREIESAHLYDYIIVNDRINEALLSLKSIILAEKNRSRHMKTILDEVINNA